MEFNDGIIKELILAKAYKRDNSDGHMISKEIEVVLVSSPSIESLISNNNERNENDIIHFKMQKSYRNQDERFYINEFNRKFDEIFECNDWLNKCPIEHFRIFNRSDSHSSDSRRMNSTVDDDYSLEASWLLTVKDIKDDAVRNEYIDKIRMVLVDHLI